MSEFHDNMTIGHARNLLGHLADEGHECPCCTQFVKVYRRKIHSSMARTLIAMYRRAGLDWLYLPDVPQRSRDSAGLRYWSLIEEEHTRREDGGRAGYWRVTSRGEWYLRGGSVREYALVFDGRVLGHEGDQRTISDALGETFNFSDLMNRE